MTIPILMPKLSFVVTQGTIIEWLKKPGESVTKGEPLLVIETEKATMDVEAPGTGILGSDLAPKGTTVPVTTTIGYLLNEGEVSPKLDIGLGEPVAFEAPITSGNKPLPEETIQIDQGRAGEAQRMKVSPLARRMANELGLDLTKIIGSGPDGRILQEDIEAFIKASAQLEEKGQQHHPSAPIPLVLQTTPSPDTNMGLTGEMQELSNLQRITAERMALSFRTAPHFYLDVQVDISQAVSIREALLPDVAAKTGLRLSFTDILLFAVARVLKIHPALNAMFDNDKLYRYQDINLCLAVDTSRGLTAPVFRQADRLSLSEIARRRVELVERAKNNRLSLDDISDGTFTVSNLGMFGIDVFNAIINPPQAAILAVGRVAKRPIVVNDILEVRSTVWLSLSVDHRAADGAMAARFLMNLVDYLENPYRIFM
jgi:pyruvate dehydrogenase E2 component (dihydrolipoamide acetyltransferase)